jgi:murein DD-endopeptidase MepM/ murein hydrolase activator NlpD
VTEPRWKIPLMWHGSACVARVVELSSDAMRIVASVAIVLGGLLFLAGHATLAHRGDALAVDAPSENSFTAMPDTLALLMSREVAPEGEPLDVTLWSLGPVGLFAGSFRNAADSLTAQVERLAATPSIMPTQGWLTSNFSRRRLHPLLHVFRPHEGIDIRAAIGTPIEAPAAGTVIKAGWEKGYGWTVEIDHGYGIITRYAHTSKMLVRPGFRVQRGELIARVGRSGLAEAPHLHYEVHQRGRAVDPLRFVLPSVIAD